VIVADRCIPPAIPEPLARVIRAEVHSALKGVTTSPEGFVVNDSPWLEVRPSGKATAAVLNEADFISKTFQKRLRELADPWSIEETIEGQKIDAFKRFTASIEGFFLDRDRLRSVVDEFWRDPELFIPLVQSNWPHCHSVEFDQMVWWLSAMYFRRRLHDVSIIPQALRHRFLSTGVRDHEIRVAIEFETGNTASAYRAFVKLNALYALDRIDLGIFIATSKADAHRIWPVSNRNVHFGELTNRGYRRSVFFPIWEIEFRPDTYSTEASYLRGDGTTYRPTATRDVFAHAGSLMPIFLVDGRRVIPAVVPDQSDPLLFGGSL
jgi:hypothetical protein